MRERKARNSGHELRKSLEAMATRKNVGGGEVAGLGDALKHTSYEERDIDAYIPSASPMSSEEAGLNRKHQFVQKNNFKTEVTYNFLFEAS